ncbi:Tetratricopeptide repeat-containing protein [Dyadobacter sp. SG02]|uniref:tetratricopeptide repeat protein n=1 Tax=Dyadobacter sp. SG02 TaxID=1855291 RepID=UPI0008C8EE67|nr:tetratricopeptide repeat protein [Dyadobacter sp. SG02]SEI45246.1 Tetratricopeptide repeat-containing protein [Dyadobacter sp. SG02]
MKTYFSMIFVALLVAVWGCGEKKESGKPVEKSNSSAGVSTEIPALYERQGELAAAAEWPKTKEKVKELRQKISENPSDVKPRLQVAVIYLSEARITGEHPYYYPAVLKILDDVLAIEPKNFEATTFKASVKMSQHQFAEARKLAEQARKINPSNAYVYGVLVDANVELGNYDEAVAMSDKMQALKPSLEAYSRASYLREIYGNYPGAIAAMKLAVEAGLPGSEPQCWAKNTLGHLYETTGQLEQAKIQYKEILAMRPSYAFALRGLAQVHKAAKQYDAALADLDKAARVMPEFSFHEEMADIYALQGNKEKANAKYREVAKMLDEDARSGHAVDLELCKLYTKTSQLDSAIAFGLKEYAKRPKNIDVNHALAAAYFKSKNNDKAKQHIEVALSTGSRDPELLQVASAIAVATGDKAQGSRLLAQAKKTNPRFVL